MKKYSTSYQHDYKIDFYIDDDSSFAFLKSLKQYPYQRLFIVIDKNVNKIWGKTLGSLFKKSKKPVFYHRVEAVEESKSIKYYPKLVSFFESHKANTGDLIIAIGGGIILDLVSFTCSTYMRGLPLWMLPTTLIGMTDASTAGKTCLNSLHHKNILGTFYYPTVVYNNINFLKTYSSFYHRQGLSEAFKYALLGSKKLLTLLEKYIDEQSNKKILKDLILETIKTRVKIRQFHPQASNLGHTFGHALEKVSNYQILHGDAIAAGIVLSLYFSYQIKLITMKQINQIVSMMKKLKLNINFDKKINIDDLIEGMKADKKNTSKHINLILIEGITKAYRSEKSPYYPITPTEMRKFLKKMKTDYPFQIDNLAQYLKKM
ncbi:MAG: 3-dehydroquinate synthase family protein [Candidatus Woesebacteria bacterium]|jgi:3-dehydroquinate synthetase